MNELNHALKTCKGTSHGLDDITYEMISNMDVNHKNKVLEIYNQIWNDGDIPLQWKKSMIIPILKPGKDRKMAESYRPIHLISANAKILERLVNFRLMFKIQKHKIISSNQFAHQKGKSTMDNLTILESCINEAFTQKKQVCAIFFDIEKAYDLTWRRLIIDTCIKSGIKGKLLKFIIDFLKDRKFKVCLNNILSQEFIMENGIPQGSVLSVILFLIAMNTIAQQISPLIR